MGTLIDQVPECFLALTPEGLIELYNLARSGSPMRHFFESLVLEAVEDDLNDFGATRYWMGDITTEKPPIALVPVRKGTNLSKKLLAQLLKTASAGNELLQVYEIALLFDEKEIIVNSLARMVSMDLPGDIALDDYLLAIKRFSGHRHALDGRLELTLLWKIFRPFQQSGVPSIEEIRPRVETASQNCLLAKILKAITDKELSFETLNKLLAENFDADTFEEKLIEAIEIFRLGNEISA